MAKYMRDNILDEYGIIELQDKILEIMVYIDSLCKNNNIEYYLMGGSALGAIRHGGFIPWDDDLDIFMSRENYCRFMKICETQLDTERFYFQREDSVEQPHFFSKIRMNGTTCIEEVHLKNKKIDQHQGIFVDIMCLNNAAKSNFGKKIQYYAAGLLKAKAITKTTYKTKNKKKKMQLFIAKCIVWGPFKKLLLHTVRKYNKKNANEYTHLFGRAKFENSFYPVSDFKSQKFVPFEKTDLAVPSGVENYLAIRYGADYMSMPSDATKKLYDGHAVKWSVNEDYKQYISL